MNTIVALGMDFFGAHLNWWETLIVILLAPTWLILLGAFWDS